MCVILIPREKMVMEGTQTSKKGFFDLSHGVGGTHRIIGIV